MTVSEDLPGYEHHGCYVDHTTGLFDGVRLPYDANNDNVKCLFRCHQQGYEVAATEYGYECYCTFINATSYDAEIADDSECSTPCSGDATQRCGGIWRQSISSIQIVIV